jgi:4-hydroxyphenylpyruvate dioxygenase-like putative hemolysin
MIKKRMMQIVVDFYKNLFAKEKDTNVNLGDVIPLLRSKKLKRRCLVVMLRKLLIGTNYNQ